MQKSVKKLLALCLMAVAAVLVTTVVAQEGGGSSLRFHGNGVNDIDRVKIKLDAPARAVDVGEDFTIEFFMKAVPGENNSGSCRTGEAGWIYGNIVVDRDVYGEGDYGDYGISLFGAGGNIAFGVSRGSAGDTLCGATNVVDGEWHHIAVTRSSSTGVLRLYVDGKLDGSTTGATGDVSYRDGRGTRWSNDPYLVIAAEKHDAGSDYPSYSGWIDELHISKVVRYDSDFTPPTQAFTPDENTVGLYHFDEGSGDTIKDSSGTGSDGVRRFGGSPQGPEWSADTAVTPASDAEQTPPATNDNAATAASTPNQGGEPGGSSPGGLCAGAVPPMASVMYAAVRVLRRFRSPARSLTRMMCGQRQHI